MLQRTCNLFSILGVMYMNSEKRLFKSFLEQTGFSQEQISLEGGTTLVFKVLVGDVRLKVVVLDSMTMLVEPDANDVVTKAVWNSRTFKRIVEDIISSVDNVEIDNITYSGFEWRLVLLPNILRHHGQAYKIVRQVGEKFSRLLYHVVKLIVEDETIVDTEILSSQLE